VSKSSSLPLVDLKAQYRAIEGEIAEALERVLERQVFINGPETAAFEAEFAVACEASDCVAVSSGTTALELALKALGVGSGDEVITVSHSFFATVGAILATGATPVLIDIEPDSWTMAPSLVAEALSERTKAIVPVHIYGHPVDVPAINAAAPMIPIVEDAAQAHLARYHGSAVGSCARAACFSFYPGKNLGSYGDAGAVVTSDPELAARLRALRDHGRTKGAKYEHELLGTNARTAELQAAVLRAKLPHLSSWTQARQELAALYEVGLEARPDVQLQAVKPWAEHARHLFVLLHPERDRLLAQLNERGIGAGVHYPLACHQQAALTERWRGTKSGLEVTEKVAASCLSLPLYPELGDDGVARVIEALEPLLLATAA
jgi:dTDP-3-amino-3,4,6-trideoxy-alpha-D-glucose transaminase